MISDEQLEPSAERPRWRSRLTHPGPLAGRYPAVAAMLVFALVPYLALSGALQPLAPIIAEQLHMSPQAMSLTVGMANAGYAILATAARENSRACPVGRARASTCLRQEEALTAGGSGRFLLKPQAESRREDRSPVSVPRPRFPAGRGMRERRSAPAGSSGSQAGAA